MHAVFTNAHSIRFRCEVMKIYLSITNKQQKIRFNLDFQFHVLDCFDRIALEAMLPFEKAFRTEDTNSLKVCKDKCIQAGEKCNLIAFG